MAEFGKRSKDNLSTVHEKIQKVMNRAIKKYDFTVVYGHRSSSEQFELFKKGRELQQDGTWKKVGSVVTNIDGKTKKSKHNHFPSLAVDVAPYPIDWNNIQRFKDMAKVILESAKEEGVKIIWGADWDMDGNIEEHKLIDYPHFELDPSEV